MSATNFGWTAAGMRRSAVSLAPSLGIAVFAAGCAAPGGDPAEVLPAPAYCERFAEAYAERNAVGYEDGSAEAVRRKGHGVRLQNLFQPPGSRFVAEYDCRFRVAAPDDEVADVSVGMFVTVTRHFAEYTQWPKTQLVPIEAVGVEAANGQREAVGYGVFKYLAEERRSWGDGSSSASPAASET